jgi:hypothetical protein
MATIATTLALSGEAERAIYTREYALEVRRAVYGPKHLQVADALDELGKELMFCDRKDAAKEVLKESYLIKVAQLPKTHEEVKKTKNLYRHAESKKPFVLFRTFLPSGLALAHLSVNH